MAALRRRRGFTLAEITVVIVIVAILAAALIPTLSGLVSQAKLRKDAATAEAFTRTLNEYLVKVDAPMYFEVDEARGILTAEYPDGPSMLPESKGKYFWYDRLSCRVQLAESKPGTSWQRLDTDDIFVLDRDIFVNTPAASRLNQQALAADMDAELVKVIKRLRVDGRDLTVIDADVFRYTSYNSANYELLEFVELTEGLTEIGASAFRDLPSLKTALLPDTLESLGQYAFAGCAALTELSLPQSLEQIGRYCFEGTALKAAALPKNSAYTTVAAGLFRACPELSQVEIPENVTSIESLAFEDCSSLKAVTIPGNASVAENAFAGCRGLIISVRAGSRAEEAVKKICEKYDYISYVAF